MSRFFGALLGALLVYIGPVSAEPMVDDPVARATAPSLFVAPARLPDLPDTPARRLDPMAPVRVRGTPASIGDALARQSDINAFGFACGQSMVVTPMAGALLDVQILAPCKPGAIVEIRHAGLSFDVTLSNTGSAQVRVPAMEYLARIDTVFVDQSAVSEIVSVPQLVDYTRIGVGWQSQAATFQGTARRGTAVQEVTLGDGTGRIVQILSHHIDPESRPGVIRLSVHKTVTAQNCARAQIAHVVHHVPHQDTVRYGLKLAGSDCDRVGDNLVLNNILPDLKLAAK